MKRTNQEVGDLSGAASTEKVGLGGDGDLVLVVTLLLARHHVNTPTVASANYNRASS